MHQPLSRLRMPFETRRFFTAMDGIAQPYQRRLPSLKKPAHWYPLDGGANRYSPTQRKWAESADIAIVAKEFADRYTEADDGTLAADPLEVSFRRLHAKGVSLAGVTVGAKGKPISSYPMAKKSSAHPSNATT